MQSKMGVKHWVQCVGPGLCPASRTQWGIKGRRISLLAPAHAVISLTPICWNHGCVTSITIVTHCATPSEQAVLSSITQLFLLTLGDSSPRALPVCTPSHTVPRCCALFLPFSAFLLPCPAQPLPLVPLSLHPRPRHWVSLVLSPSLPSSSSLQFLFQACKSPCARWEDIFLIHPHYQQSASRFEQPCQLLRNETIANIWWISWLSTLLITQMNCKKKKHSLLWTNDSLTSLLFETQLSSLSYIFFLNELKTQPSLSQEFLCKILEPEVSFPPPLLQLLFAEHHYHYVMMFLSS